MRSAPKTPEDGKPSLLPARDRRRAALRLAGLGAGLLAVFAAFGCAFGPAAAAAGAAVLAMLVERRALRGEWAELARVTNEAARTAGERDGIAQSLSLQLAYERSRSVFESLREGVLVVDGGGEIVLANPAARRAMKNPAQDPVGSLLWEALSPALASRARDAFHALRSAGAAADGAAGPVRCSGVPCRDSVFDLTAVGATSQRTGQDFGTVFLLVDSTRAYELQRLKERFLSSVSHELRTPLTNICAYSEILRHLLPGESAEWPEFVRVIHEEGLQLSHLVDAMFDYLQLESGEAPFASEQLDGAAIVRRVVTEAMPQAHARGIRVDLRIGDRVPAIVADRQRLEQVVHNLFDNAVKFTPARGLVEVNVESRGDGWQLRVDDSGSGVPEAERQSVFEKFNQLADHMTDKPAGTGIGLASSRAIVARFGGLIWCESSPLGGAAFLVLLPALGQPQLVALETPASA